MEILCYVWITAKTGVIGLNIEYEKIISYACMKGETILHQYNIACIITMMFQTQHLKSQGELVSSVLFISTSVQVALGVVSSHGSVHPCPQRATVLVDNF